MNLEVPTTRKVDLDTGNTKANTNFTLLYLWMKILIIAFILHFIVMNGHWVDAIYQILQAYVTTYIIDKAMDIIYIPKTHFGVLDLILHQKINPII